MTTDDAVEWKSAYRFLEQELEFALTRVADRMEQLEKSAGSQGAATVRAVTLHQKESGDLESVIVADGADLRYAFAVYRDDVLVREQEAGQSNTIVWPPSRSGTYRVQGTVRSGRERDAATGRSGELAVTVSKR